MRHATLGVHNHRISPQPASIWSHTSHLEMRFRFVHWKATQPTQKEEPICSVSTEGHRSDRCVEIDRIRYHNNKAIGEACLRTI